MYDPEAQRFTGPAGAYSSRVLAQTTGAAQYSIASSIFLLVSDPLDKGPHGMIVANHVGTCCSAN